MSASRKSALKSSVNRGVSFRIVSTRLCRRPLAVDRHGMPSPSAPRTAKWRCGRQAWLEPGPDRSPPRSKSRFSSLKVQFALLGASDRAAKIFRPPLRRGSRPSDTPGTACSGQRTFSGSASNKMRQIEAFSVRMCHSPKLVGMTQTLPIGFGSFAVPHGAVGTANQPDFRRRGVRAIRRRCTKVSG